MKYILLILLLLSFIFFIIFSDSISTQKDISPSKYVTNWGDTMIKAKNGGPGRNCMPTIFSTSKYPELKEVLQEAEKLKIFTPDKNGEAPLIIPGENCFNKAKLVKLKIDSSGKMAWAIYRCENDNMGIEVQLSSYENYCSYTRYLKKWNFPIGKYTYENYP
ncbi:hypothetical protein [Acinetobacter sp. RW6]|uniref:hypothetical protein n=1 Tax=Acinetobacter sp. RW6 TaxID=3242680 RepID=UPI0035C08BF1